MEKTKYEIYCPDAVVEKRMINYYWPTTGTMGTRIKHPNRKHPQQMYRRKIDAELAKQIISIRKHTGKGYYTKNKRSRRKHGGNTQLVLQVQLLQKEEKT